jgi:flavin-dependent dehydrogenase
VSALVAGDVMLAGDAAGQTHPITGAGVATAVMAGTLAGEAAARGVRSSDLSLLRETWIALKSYGRPLEGRRRHATQDEG